MLSLGRVAFVCAVMLSCSTPDAGELFSEPISQSGASSSTDGGTSAAHAGKASNGTGGTRTPSSAGGGGGKPGPTGASGGKAGNRPKAESGTGNTSTESAGAGGWMEPQGGAPDLGGRSGASGSSGASGASGATGTGGTGGSAGSAGTAGNPNGGTAGTAGHSNGGTAGSEEPACEPQPERCDGLDNDCDSVVDLDACPHSCVGATRPEDGHLYLLCYTTPLNWFAAQEYCASQGAALVEIDSSAENQFLSAQLLRLFIEVGDAAWIGASDRDHEGQWGWYRPDGSTPFFDGNSPTGTSTGTGFNAWREGEPNNQNDEEHCASIEHTEGDGPWLWNDRSCEDELPAFACEHL